MANVVVNDTNLTNIANAIREKNGLTNTYKPSEMAAAILAITTGGGGGADIEPIVLTGDVEYACAGQISGVFIDLYGDKISTENLTTLKDMFYQNTATRIPFELNMVISSSPVTTGECFCGCGQLLEVPVINNLNPSDMYNFFQNCSRIREIPDEMISNWNFTSLNKSAYGSTSSIFKDCYSLRKISSKLLGNIYTMATGYTSVLYYYLFNGCHTLDRIEGLAVQPSTLTENRFSSTFSNCNRLEWLTFATQKDGTPYTANWKNQTIDLSSGIGYVVGSAIYITNYNSGCTEADKVTIDSYNQFYANPNAWTYDANCSAYNASRAANTIASLPDTSAYLATAGGTNTIKFENLSGGKSYRGDMDTPYGFVGPQINETTLAAAIADAATKGWTVSLV